MDREKEITHAFEKFLNQHDLVWVELVWGAGEALIYYRHYRRIVAECAAIFRDQRNLLPGKVQARYLSQHDGYGSVRAPSERSFALRQRILRAGSNLRVFRRVVARGIVAEQRRQIPRRRNAAEHRPDQLGISGTSDTLSETRQ